MTPKVVEYRAECMKCATWLVMMIIAAWEPPQAPREFQSTCPWCAGTVLYTKERNRRGTH